MKPLMDFTAKEGNAKGRVQVTLTTDDDTLRVWLAPKQAEELAAAILQARFEIPYLKVKAPRHRRRMPVYITLQPRPPEPGPRPFYHEDTLAKYERIDPEIRTKLKAEQERWDRKAARRPPRPRPFFGTE
jgi:hypothetical protein